MKYLLIFGALAVAASAHVHMASPPPLRAQENPNVVNIDYSINDPLNPDGSNFPCKGYHLDTAEMGSVADYAPGSSQKVSFAEGGAGHNGGSCQVSISVDGGNTFKVIRSFMGGCPVIADGNGGSSPSPGLDFTIPKDTPAGPALLSWSWNNRVGNREFYQNCASVTVTSEGAGSEAIPFDQRPDMFTANLGKGCTTAESIDVEYPDPGPDPVIHPSAKLGDPTGGEACGKAVSGGAPKIPGAPDGAKEVVPDSPASSTLAAPAAGNSGTPNSGAPKPAALVPDTTLALDPTELGRCGPVDGTSYTCKGSPRGPSCSSFGYCGKTAEHSGPGCQAQFGECSGTAGIGASSTKSLAVESPATSVQSTASSFLGEQQSSAASSPSSPPKTTTEPTTASSTETATSSILPSEDKNASITSTGTSAAPVPSGDASTPVAGLPIHPDGKCGVLPEGKFTCVGSGRGCACSSAGWCGISPAHFGQGCQSAFGTCGDEAAFCKVTIQSGTPSNGTAIATKSVDKVQTTSLVLTTVPVLTVTVTETDATETGTMNTVAVPTTLETKTKPATTSEVKSEVSSEAPSGTTAAATIVPRFKRPAGSFLDFLDGSKSVAKIGTKGPKPSLGSPFNNNRR